jgi:transcriptional regulator with PAS, ATPase and Fis domain
MISGEESVVEYRIQRSDGNLRWLSSRGSRQYGRDGEPDRLMGVSIDVTEPKRIEAELTQLRELLQAETDYLKEEIQERGRFDEIVGQSQELKKVFTRIEQVASTDSVVLITGETGAGKELVARQIHELSRRRSGPFVAINCAALVETLLEAELFGIEERTATGVRGRRGKFEAAEGGTLFLDEVSDLSVSAQAKLLRAIQDLAVERVGGHGTHRVDIRIVAATNRGLTSLVEQRLFRPDLFYRLSGVDIRVPALRERRPDILELASYFLERHRTTRLRRLSAGASDALMTYDWPGNVRELERLMERAVTLVDADVIELDDLPPALRGDYAMALGPSLRRNDSLRAWASRYARLVLNRCEGNKREACRVLDISYHTLQSYLRFPVHGEADTTGESWPGQPESEGPLEVESTI